MGAQTAHRPCTKISLNIKVKLVVILEKAYCSGKFEFDQINAHTVVIPTKGFGLRLEI